MRARWTGLVSAALLGLGLVPFAAPDAHAASIRQVIQACDTFKGQMIPSPEFTNALSPHTLRSSGRMSGCNRAGGGGTFSMQWSIPNSNCATLSGYRSSGSATFNWANGRVSKASINVQVLRSAPSKVAITGRVSGGDYWRDLLVDAEIRSTPVFTGTGPQCSRSNPLRKLEFTNSRSLRFGNERSASGVLPTRPAIPGGSGVDENPAVDRGDTLPTTGPHPFWGALGLGMIGCSAALLLLVGPNARRPRRGERRLRIGRPLAWLEVRAPRHDT
jgi:hypothetical protein